MGPLHGRPPLAGSGLLHSLILSWNPCPQVLLHGPHSLQLEKPPLTGEDSKVYKKKNKKQKLLGKRRSKQQPYPGGLNIIEYRCFSFLIVCHMEELTLNFESDDPLRCSSLTLSQTLVLSLICSLEIKHCPKTTLAGTLSNGFTLTGNRASGQTLWTTCTFKQNTHY